MCPFSPTVAVLWRQILVRVPSEIPASGRWLSLSTLLLGKCCLAWSPRTLPWWGDRCADWFLSWIGCRQRRLVAVRVLWWCIHRSTTGEVCNFIRIVLAEECECVAGVVFADLYCCSIKLFIHEKMDGHFSWGVSPFWQPFSKGTFINCLEIYSEYFSISAFQKDLCSIWSSLSSWIALE